MRTRDDAIVYQETQSSDKSSKTFDLKYTDPLSALYLEFEAVNGTTSNEDNFISDIITKVEIVDGAKPLVSLTQHELEALHFYKRKHAPVLFPSEWASGTQRHGALLMFGRDLWDTEFALDCKKYKNPQLKITWDLGAVRAVSATTAFATGTLKLSVIAKVMEEVALPAKFLSAREIDAWTMPTTGSHRSEMYTDAPWRLMMIRCFLEGYDPREMIQYLTLNCDLSKFKPLDNRYLQQLDAEEFSRSGWVELTHNIFRATGGVVRGLCQVETQYQFKPNISTQFTDFVHTLNFSGNVTLETQIAGGGGAGTRQFWGQEKGHALHGTTPVFFGDPMRPETWFDATKYGKIDLYTYAPSAGGAAGVSSVTLEQPRQNGE